MILTRSLGADELGWDEGPEEYPLQMEVERDGLLHTLNLTYEDGTRVTQPYSDPAFWHNMMPEWFYPSGHC